VISLIVTLLGFILPLVEDYFKSRKSIYAQDKQKFDNALATRNTDSLSVMFERMCIPAGSGASKKPGN